MFIPLSRSFWNLDTLVAYQKNPRNGNYLLMFPIGGGNIKVTPKDPSYAVVDEYCSRKTQEGN